MKLLGAVLAGGQSRRFGSDKAAALLGGGRLLDHAAKALLRYADDVIVVGRSDPVHRSLADMPQAGLGPLGGVCAALLHAASYGYDEVLTLPCDVPELPSGIAGALIAACPAALASQPVVGCWPARLGGTLEAYLARGERRAVRAWCEAAGVRLLDLPPLPNINRPQDLPER